jgi:hypothetical protein
VDSVKKIQEIAMRLDHLESAGEWIALTQIDQDTPASQTGSLISALADDIRKRVLDLVSELEKEIYISSRTH